MNRSILLALCFFVLAPLWAEERADPTFVAYMDNELREIESDVEKQFKERIPITPEDLAEVQNAAVVLAGENDTFEKKEPIQVFWKKIHDTDSNDGSRQAVIVLLVVYSHSQFAPFGRFVTGNKDLIRAEVFTGAYLKLDRKSAVCDECLGGTLTRHKVEATAEKLLEEKPLELDLKKKVEKKVKALRARFGTGKPADGRLLIYHGVFEGPGMTEAAEEERQVVAKLRSTAQMNGIQIVKDSSSDSYYYTLVGQDKFEELVGGDESDLWNECKRFFGIP